jgi:hypothetical protein
MSAPAAKTFSFPVMTMTCDGVVGVQLLEGILQVDGERIVERVHPRRAVEANESDAIVCFDENVFIGHCAPPMAIPGEEGGCNLSGTMRHCGAIDEFRQILSLVAVTSALGNSRASSPTQSRRLHRHGIGAVVSHRSRLAG